MTPSSEVGLLILSGSGASGRAASRNPGVPWAVGWALGFRPARTLP